MANKEREQMTEVDPDELPSDRGICDLCEDRPLAPGDEAMCAPCRADTDAITDEVPDPVEHVLNKHARFEPLCTEDKTLCRCGAEFSGGAGYHRRHVAEEVYIALRDAGQTVSGPLPWVFGERSPSRERFGGGGRITPDGGWPEAAVK